MSQQLCLQLSPHLLVSSLFQGLWTTSIGFDILQEHLTASSGCTAVCLWGHTPVESGHCDSESSAEWVGQLRSGGLRIVHQSGIIFLELHCMISNCLLVALSAPHGMIPHPMTCDLLRGVFQLEGKQIHVSGNQNKEFHFLELCQEVKSGYECYFLACYRTLQLQPVGTIIEDSLGLSPLPIPELSKT